MKQLIFALFLIGIIGYIAFHYVAPIGTEWTQHGQNNFRNMVVLFISLVVCPKPLACIVVSLAELFFPTKEKGLPI